MSDDTRLLTGAEAEKFVFAYNAAVSNLESSFKWKGHPVLCRYAFYVIEHLQNGGVLEGFWEAELFRIKNK